MRRMARWVFAILFSAAAPLAAQPPKRAVDFETEVRPIFAKACYSCHGPDKQKSDFRLDKKDIAMKGGENGLAIIAGKSAESPLIERISGGKGRMPPTGNDPLSVAQVAIIKSWIEQGAKWPDYPATASDKPHWAYQPLARVVVPTTGTSPVARNAIDAFIQAKLREKGLTPSPPAQRRHWLRRVTFNLTGLPPTPEELAAFERDAIAQPQAAMEQVVDRLLASPHYGERWARHWMDVAHFAESHGHDQDRPRPNAWPYRDYLVRSFNDDKPYARFVAEQVAGDVLFPDDPQAVAALGFLAAGPWDESSLRDIVAGTSDNLFAQVLDRDDMLTTVMTTFVSATVNCARCHNHKFDPISAQDYYALQAVFAGVDKAERSYDPDPAIALRRRELQARLKEIEKGMPDAALLAPANQALVEAWERRNASRRVEWATLHPTGFSASKGSTAALQPDGSLLYLGKAPETDTYWIGGRARGAITGVRLEVLADDKLPMKGPGRQDNGNLHLSEFRVLVWPGFGVPPIVWPIKRAVADFDQAGWTIAHALDNNPKTAWGIHPEVGKNHTAIFEFAKPLLAPRGARVTVMLAQLHGGRHLIGRPRISTTEAANPLEARPLPAPIAALIAASSTQRSPAQRLELTRYVMRSQVEEQLTALPPMQLVYAGAADFKPDGSFKPLGKPKAVHVLKRGDLNSPVEVARPGTLGCIPSLPSRFDLASADDEGQRRAALARWLTHGDNVLTWRSIVNRVWHYHFGRGLVDTPSDFGKMGSAPTHPELLDWLARDFRDHGGSIKRLHRQIVLSATYSQSSRIDPKAATTDADNRYLGHMSVSRLDAESLRDAVLMASGRLDRRMGGPSDKQFIQTPGIHVTPNVDYANFAVDDPAQMRRSVYRFLFRTLPDPFMEALDHPDGSQQAPVRAGSITAPQALALLNNKFVVRQSEHLAARLKGEAPTIDEQIRRLLHLVLSREATPPEIAMLVAHTRKHGLANVCRLVFNSNEFVFVP